MLTIFSRFVSTTYLLSDVSLVHTDATQKADVLQEHLAHLKLAEDARQHMNSCVDPAKACKHGELGELMPLTGSDYGHYAFEFAQQVIVDFNTSN